MATMGAQAGLQCMSRQEIEAAFPNLRNSGYSITSPATAEYNCIAWASGDTGAWWWPDPMNLYYWPPAIPRENTFLDGLRSLVYGTIAVFMKRPGK